MVVEKRVLLTTSKKPKKNMRTLCKDFSHTFPNIVRINRGKMGLDGVIAKTVELNCQKTIIVERWSRGIGKVEFLEVKQGSLVAVPPIIYIQNVRFRKNFENQISKRQKIRSIAITTSSNKNLEKIENALANFFEIPVISRKNAINPEYNIAMQISSDISHSTSITFRQISDFVEFGPRIEIAQLVWMSKR